MVAKYQRVAETLTRGIQAGTFQPGERLPGEIDLARSFDVSRSTIRQALSSLQHAGLIETWSGAGSFVCYDGARIDDGLGWSRALARHGVAVQARILRFERVEDVPLAETLDLPAATFPGARPGTQHRGGQADFAGAQPASLAAGLRHGPHGRSA